MKRKIGLTMSGLFSLTAGACAAGTPAVHSTEVKTPSVKISAVFPEKAAATTLAKAEPVSQARAAEFYPLAEEVLADLNGDGKKERIYYDVNDLRINGTKFESETLDNIYFLSPVTEHFILADIDASDKQKEIGLKVMGPSDDPEVYFFTYDDGELIFLGSIPSLIQNLNHSFDGKGNIKGVKRLEILQTWYAPAAWKLDADNRIVPAPQELYYPVEYKWQEEVILKEDLPIYASRTDEEPTGVLKPQQVDFTATDNKQWVEVEGRDGTKGWFKMTGFSTVTDLKKDATEVFDQLSMAD